MMESMLVIPKVTKTARMSMDSWLVTGLDLVKVKT
jgi:hypothetical protein